MSGETKEFAGWAWSEDEELYSSGIFDTKEEAEEDAKHETQTPKNRGK